MRFHLVTNIQQTKNQFLGTQYERGGLHIPS